MGLCFLFWEGRRAAGRADAKCTETVLHNAGTTPASNRQGCEAAAVAGGEDVQVDAFCGPRGLFILLEKLGSS